MKRFLICVATLAFSYTTAFFLFVWPDRCAIRNLDNGHFQCQHMTGLIQWNDTEWDTKEQAERFAKSLIWPDPDPKATNTIEIIRKH